MAAVSVVNPKSDVLRRSAALQVNCSAAKGLQDVLKSNLGPKGTLKMLVGGAGQIKITKDGNVLLHEMQIQHPTASIIARAATAQDDITGDGTTSQVLFIGELMTQAQRYLSEGVHPRVLSEGFEVGLDALLQFLEAFKVPFDIKDREILQSVALTSLSTKVDSTIAQQLRDVVVSAVELIKIENEQIDLHMIEVLHMKHRFATESRLVRGMVLDHGSRHPDMPKILKKCYILTLNVSLEYEKSEVNSGFFYSSAEQREKLVEAERRFTDEKVKKIINFKREVCVDGHSFVIINQKGIDPPSLDMLAKEDIIALRRAKRRNMERMTLSCGGNAMNSVEDLKIEDLGEAGVVYEEVLGEDKYTFVEDVKHPRSCTILVKGQNDHTIAQMKDAIRDGTRAVKNALEDGHLVPGAGAFEIAAHCMALEARNRVEGKRQLGVQALADALLVIPKTLAENSGIDAQDTILKLITEYKRNSRPVGLDLTTGEMINPIAEGIWDNYGVKKQTYSMAPSLAQQLLLVDEVIKAGKQMGQK
eukprot:GHVL01017386.1.p1 GENE.GHVL01017386.1~~GHVL01017386.1.p1  ORF type:complete len:532 (+),score=117.63 GHVL01017386.1:44-1639(+)